MNLNLRFRPIPFPRPSSLRTDFSDMATDLLTAGVSATNSTTPMKGSPVPPPIRAGKVGRQARAGQGSAIVLERPSTTADFATTADAGRSDDAGLLADATAAPSAKATPCRFS